MTSDDEKILTEMNLQIGGYEHEGNWKALRDLMATQELRTGGHVPVLAFRRAGGACIDARAFLDGVAKSAERQTEPPSITPEGDHIAIVRCLVDMDGKTYRNVRLFVRDDKSSRDWRLLAWANEPVA